MSRRSGLRLGRAGMTSPEFAVAATGFLTMLLLTMEVCYGLAVGAALDHGARVASRFGSTGATSLASIPNSTRMSAMQSLVVQGASPLLTASNLQITESSYANFASAAAKTGAASGPGLTAQVVRYTLTYAQPYLTPIAVVLTGSKTLIHTSAVVVLNEPY